MQIESTKALPAGRAKLVAVVRQGGDVITVTSAMPALGLDRVATAKTLARWTGQGWLRRVGRGRYVPATLDTLDDPLVLTDPWVLVPSLYDPSYIGGRTAASHWDLTEQIFNDVVVMTARPVRAKEERRHGVIFSLTHVARRNIFGTVTLWRGRTRVAVADVHRTIVDMLDNPALGGGMQHVADCLAAYLKRSDRDDRQLLAYADRLGNGAVFKRLGFLAEAESRGAPLAAACRERLTAGRAKLDPVLPADRLVTRWRLWVPATWSRA